MRLQGRSEELRANLRKMRFDNKMGQLDDTSKLGKARRELALVQTQLNQIRFMEAKVTQ